MNQAIVLTRNTLYMVFSELAKPLVSYFLIVYISRVMGKEGVGLYSTVLAVITLFETLAILGMGNVITRDVAVDQRLASTYITSSLVVGLITSLISLVMLAFLLQVLDFEEQVTSGIAIISISMIFFVSTSTIQAFFEGLQRMEYKSIANTLETFLRVSLGILAIRYGYGIIGVLWAVVMVRIIVFAYSLIAVLRLLPMRPARPDRQLMTGLVRQSMIFLLITFMVTSCANLDVLVLSQLRGSEDVGIYAASFRLIVILKGLTYGYIVALFPQMASAYAKSGACLHTRSSQSVKYMLILTIPVAVGTTILSDRIIHLLYGQNFAESAFCLQILIWTICLFPIALVLARALVASHHQVYDLISNVAAMISSLGLNLLLIPIWGVYGAAFSALLSMLIFFAFEYAFVRKLLFRLNLLAECRKPLISGLAMGLCTYALKDWNLFAAISGSAIVYSLLLLFLRTFSAEERGTFYQVWRDKYRLLTHSFE